MAAPSATARQTPGGLKLKNGYQTEITFSADPDVSFWEESVKPPGVDGGDAVDQTTMFNTTYRTKAPRTLKTLTDATFKARYDPAVITQIIALVNVENVVTLKFPDGSTWAFNGFLKMVEFDDMTDGTGPTLTGTVVCTNMDASQAEQGVTLTNVAGT